MKIYNNILFLYSYFKELETSIHTDPQYVTFNGKNYVFRESHNDMENHIVSYGFDDEPLQVLSIPKEELNKIITDIGTREHEKIAKSLKSMQSYT